MISFHHLRSCYDISDLRDSLCALLFLAGMWVVLS